MPGNRRARIEEAGKGASDADLATHVDRVCAVCVRLVGVTGAGLVLNADDDGPQTICVTDPVTEQMEELQFALGEGPGVDAHRLRRPVLEPDLATVDGERWPVFTPAALAKAIAAVFAFPLQIGAIRLGTLELYRDRAGPMADEQLADALLLADVAVDGILDLQALTRAAPCIRGSRTGATGPQCTRPPVSFRSSWPSRCPTPWPDFGRTPTPDSARSTTWPPTS